MKRITTIVCLSIATLFVTGCGPGPQAPKSCTPDWYLLQPEMEGTMYAVALSLSPSLENAMMQAEMDAADKIAGRMESKMSSVSNRVRKETGIGADTKMQDHYERSQERLVRKWSWQDNK